jgi:hypothetical protein
MVGYYCDATFIQHGFFYNGKGLFSPLDDDADPNAKGTAAYWPGRRGLRIYVRGNAAVMSRKGLLN